jgi:hypothetical protein
VGVAVLFGTVYFLKEASFTTTQLVCGIAVAVLVYGGTMALAHPQSDE